MRTTIVFVATLVMATVALAHDGVKDPDVMARMHAMKDASKAMTVLGSMAKGETDFDQITADAARTELARLSGQFIGLFEKPARDPKSEALSTIWVSYPEFAQRALNMNAAFLALDTRTLDDLRTGLPKAGATCLSCHQSFRKKKP